MGQADLHIHSVYSYDAATTVRAILKHAADVNLDVIAVTDHDDLRGSLEACQLAPRYGLEVIPAAEVLTREGHLLALFIKTLPPAGMSLSDTLLHIGRQGGIAILPHPFNNLPNSLQEESVFAALADARLKGVLKGIETHNMGTQSVNGTAQKLSIYLPLAKIAASDAHVYWAIGAARTEFPGKTAQDLRQALDSNLTIPIPYNEKFLPRGILSWLRYIFLRRLGYAVDVRASQQVDTQRLSSEYIRYIRNKFAEKK
jgi:predicted metal-dependent phosphoesterase TrpH